LVGFQAGDLLEEDTVGGVDGDCGVGVFDIDVSGEDAEDCDF
jgi:hypothetical protein